MKGRLETSSIQPIFTTPQAHLLFGHPWPMQSYLSKKMRGRSPMQNSSAVFAGSGDSTQWAQERLDSWKEVASFFRREVRTVQLWEKSEGLPVRRQYHKKLGSVYAYRQELEAWWVARSAMQAGYGRPTDPGGEVRASNSDMPASVSTPPVGTALSRILAFPFEVIHSPLDRGPMRQIVERFAEGLRDDLVLELMRLQFHPIIFPLKGRPSPGTSTLALMKNVAREFEAETLISGSIRYSGNQLRVSVQMIRATDSLCLWSDRFDTGLDNILHAQADLAFRISQALPENVIRSSARVDRHEKAEHGGLALHACSMGFHHWQRRGHAALMKALSYFQDAIELDPQCADAYAGLADTYVSLSYNHLMPARKAAANARSAVETALRLDPKSVKVRNALINLLINCSWDWSAAERKCRELTDSGTMDGRTVQLYSSLMNCLGQHENAISLALHAYRLEPLSDLINGQVSLAYFYAGDYTTALSFIRRTIDLQPQFLMGYALLGRTEVELGNWEEAISVFTRGLDISHCSPFLKALLAYAHAGSGDASSANALLSELEEESQDECFPAYDVSAVHAILNQEKQALQNIYRAYGARDMKTIFVKHDPRFARMRGSSGFQQIASALCSGIILQPAI
jgi:TolB-like protein/tetratricopeptide (TPR) repeat protein